MSSQFSGSALLGLHPQKHSFQSAVVMSICSHYSLSYKSAGQLLGWRPAEKPGTQEQTRVTHSNYTIHSAFIECRFTQSRTSTYINILLTLSQSMTNTTQTHSNQWGIMDPSPRVSVCRSGRQHSGKGSGQCLARKDLWSQVGRGADKVLSPAEHSVWWLMTKETAWHGAASLYVELSCLSDGLEPASVIS